MNTLYRIETNETTYLYTQCVSLEIARQCLASLLCVGDIISYVFRRHFFLSFLFPGGFDNHFFFQNRERKEKNGYGLCAVYRVEREREA